MAALAFMAGVGPRWLAARWPDERAILSEIIEAATRIRAREREDLAAKLQKALGNT